jgi:hypothetical protein
MRRLFWLYAVLLAGLPVSKAAETNIVRFTGKVTDATGKPLASSRIVVNRVSGAPIIGDILAQKTLTDSNGVFELPLLLRPTTAASVECQLWFEHKGFIREERELTVDANQDVAKSIDAALKPGLILSGTVRFPKTAPPFRGYLLRVGGDNFEQYLLADKSGAFELYVPPGEYEVSTPNEAEPITVTGVKAGTTNVVVEPKSFEWSEASVGQVFDNFWREMDLQYSYFFLKTNVDWAALGKEFRPRAVRAQNAGELGNVLKEMLSALRDLHIWLEWPGGGAGSYGSSYNFNGNGKVTRAAISETAQCGKFAIVGRSNPDGFGYLLILRQSNATEDLVKQTIAAINDLRDVPGFIVDLRGANGGNEALAQEIAQRFCAKDVVYAKSKYRNGRKHTDFTRAYERTLTASKDPYTKPVVCIIGPGAVSSGEGFAKMMMALPHVTTVGMPTRGASGNPKPYKLGGTGVTVTFSRWVDLLPNGVTFEGRGIPPQVLVDEPATAYADRDPTLEKAFEVLRSKIAESKSAK